jgi:regulatory protein
VFNTNSDRNNQDGDPRRTPRKPRKLSRDYLVRAAATYLGRYESTERNLRTVLRRKARVRLEAHDAGEELRRDSDVWIEEIVAKAVAIGGVDDRRYAEAMARRLERRGLSHRAAWAKLREKSVSNELAQELLGSSAKPDAEFASASAYARRRGLGPYRHDPEVRSERRQRDLGALARAGFSIDTARRVLDAADPDELPDTGFRHAFT